MIGKLRSLILACGWALFQTCTSHPVYAHDAEILQCGNNLHVDHAKKIEEWVLQNGLLAEAYDRNDDGKADIVTLSVVTGHKEDGENVVIEHRPHPLFYEVDVDYDTVLDAVYIDRVGNGVCNDIVLYQDMSEPRLPEPGEQPGTPYTPQPKELYYAP